MELILRVWNPGIGDGYKNASLRRKKVLGFVKVTRHAQQLREQGGGLVRCPDRR